jgi:hypothetical protein
LYEATRDRPGVSAAFAEFPVDAAESRVGRRRFDTSAALLCGFLALVLLTFVLPVLHLVGTWNGGWLPSGDDAVIEHVTRQVGRHAVDTGVYSRFGWHHPGPALFYLLAVPYRLTGSSSTALPLTALLVNGGCVVAFAVLLRRRAGTAAAVWGLLVLAVYLRRLVPGFVREDWNPFIALLPFTVLVLVCWCIVLGDRWLLPAAAGLGSFCVQCHIGYAIGVAAVWGATVLGLAVRAVRARGRRPSGWARRWVLPAGATALVLALFWVLPVIDQLTGRPGNLTLLIRYFRSQRPGWTLHEAVRQLSTTLGWLPGWVSGAHLHSDFLAPALLPAWTGLLALLAFLAAVAVGTLRHRAGGALGLAVAVGVVGAAALLATVRVVGPLYTYLVQWIWTVGVLLWVFIGMVGLDLLRALAARRPALQLHGWSPRHAVALSVVPALALAALSVDSGLRAARDTTATIPEIRPLAIAADGWLHRQQATTVTVRYAPTTKPVFVGTLDSGNAMVLALERAGFDVQMPLVDRNVFGPATTDHPDRAQAAIVVGFADGYSPPPGPGEVFLARAGGYQIYGAPLR